MKLKIIAGVLGVPLEQLRNRDKAYQLELVQRRARVLRRWLAAIGALTLLIIAAGFSNCLQDGSTPGFDFHHPTPRWQCPLLMGWKSGARSITNLQPNPQEKLQMSRWSKQLQARSSP